jgi:hypothetical protein
MSITLDGTAGITAPAISGDAIATQAEAEAGTNNTKLMTPLRAAQSVSRFVPDVENRIINGAFDFWQRGTSQTVGGYGSVDRWTNTLVGGSSTMSRQSFALGDTLGNNSPTFFLRQTISGQTLTSHVNAIQQRIEGVRSYSGQTITVLGWARRSSGTGNMSVSFDQNFGTGGSPSSGVVGVGQIVSLASSWAPFAITFAIPSITGKVLGTNNNDNLTISFFCSAGSDYNTNSGSLGLQTIGVDLWGIHIKVGTHTAAATDRYRQPELGPELARCQRYYQRYVAGASSGQITFIRSATGTNQYDASFVFPTPMRTTPAGTISFANIHKPNVIFDTPLSSAIIPQDSSFTIATILPTINSTTATSAWAFGGFFALDAEL